MLSKDNKINILTTCNDLDKFSKSSLTHGYFVGAAVSYNWDFLICIKFCEAIEPSRLLCAVAMYMKCLYPQRLLL